MVEIDWGDVGPSATQRARIERAVERVTIQGPVIGLRRRGNGYEARVETGCSPAELRLHDDDLSSVVDRAMALLEIVERGSG